MQTIKDLNGDELALYRANKRARNIIFHGLLDEVWNFVDSCSDAKTMWKVIERLMQGTKVGKQDWDTTLIWEYEKLASIPGESLESYYTRFSKILNYLTRNKLNKSIIKEDIKFLLNLQQELEH